MWNANYDQYCVNNYIGQAYKPFQQCIDKKNIYTYNQRIGMEVSEVNG
jgi:hypothetical protein